ncbi:MAG: hypothetical protein BJ554DRAFT_3286 [Olpidium bornovanus]|uniref:Disease resistance R13L4/SHOC-2-like LRR domain-containing protein n=1 Tax=Olpidium bornovanus TaxID=278681 RepID=A0A8H8A0T3_9FUNG|nr:MAG: hypothetical protein BJ554DRAFT_3286 [Olpidium bornovanus]
MTCSRVGDWFALVGLLPSCGEVRSRSRSGRGVGGLRASLGRTEWRLPLCGAAAPSLGLSGAAAPFSPQASCASLRRLSQYKAAAPSSREAEMVWTRGQPRLGRQPGARKTAPRQGEEKKKGGEKGFSRTKNQEEEEEDEESEEHEKRRGREARVRADAMEITTAPFSRLAPQPGLPRSRGIHWRFRSTAHALQLSLGRLCKKAERHLCVIWFLAFPAVTHRFFVRHRDGTLGTKHITLAPQLKSPPGFGLAEHRITELVAAIKRLDLARNLLKSLPPTLYQLTGLEYLDVSFNAIEVLDRAVGQLRQLRRLVLDGNRLEWLPQEIVHLQKLNELQVSNNRLKFMPAELGMLQSLRNVECGGNPGLSVSPQFFAALTGGGHSRQSSAASGSSTSAHLRVYNAIYSVLERNAVSGGEAPRAIVAPLNAGVASQRRRPILRLSDIALQVCAQALAEDPHRYCAPGARCRRAAAESPPSSAAAPRGRGAQWTPPAGSGQQQQQQQQHHHRHHSQRKRQPSRLSARSTGDVRNLCALDAVPAALLACLRRSQPPPWCTMCRRPIYHGGLLFAGEFQILATGSISFTRTEARKPVAAVSPEKVVPIVYILCGNRCRAVSRVAVLRTNSNSISRGVDTGGFRFPAKRGNFCEDTLQTDSVTGVAPKRGRRQVRPPPLLRILASADQKLAAGRRRRRGLRSYLLHLLHAGSPGGSTEKLLWL